MDAFSVGLGIAAQTFFGIGAKDVAKRSKVVSAHLHHGAAGQLIVKVDIVLARTPPRDHGISIGMNDVGRVNESFEKVIGGVKTIVESLEDNRSVRFR